MSAPTSPPSPAKDRSDLRLLTDLWPYLRPQKRLLLMAASITVFTALMALARPLIMQRVIDDGVLAGNPELLYQGGIALLVLVVIEQLLVFAQTYSIQIVGARSMARLRTTVFRRLHALKIGYFDDQPVGRLVTRVTNDIDAILELFASGALNAIGDLVRLLGIVIVMVALDWRLSLIAFAATPIIALLVFVVRKLSRSAFREIRTHTAQLNASMGEQVAGISVIQAFRRENKSAREFDDTNVAYRDSNLRAIKYEAMQDAAIEMVQAVCFASIVISLGYREVSFGTLVAFTAYLIQFFEPMSQLAQRITLLQSALSGSERVLRFLDETRDGPFDAPMADRDTNEAGRSRGPIMPHTSVLEFDDVDFAYKPGVPILRKVSFGARTGDKIALVGPTGAGKSTVASLLLRLYEIDAGQIRIEGRDIRQWDRHELRRKFSVVPQDVFLFPGTIAQNIAAGSEVDHAKVRAVLEHLDVLELFEQRPDGLDADVGEHGSQYSAGERQLIAFARALYRDAPYLILDEATASIDSETEARMQRALEVLMEGRTAIIIAHRLSTIRSADRIISFHAGAIAEQGTHEELLNSGGLYAKLHQLQFAPAIVAQ